MIYHGFCSAAEFGEQLICPATEHKTRVHLFYRYLTDFRLEEIKIYVNYSARAIEALGVLILVTGSAIALIKYLFNAQVSKPRSYKTLRQEIGRTILLGLEILVAGDIIATVVTEPTMDRILALAVIVLIRTFLSISIQVEIEGKFPWQRGEKV